MYPADELDRLAAHKVALRRRIAFHRVQCIGACSDLGRPVAWLDRMVAHWRRLSPFARMAALPLGFMVKRQLFPKTKLLGSVLRWAPLVLTAVRRFRSARSAQQ